MTKTILKYSGALLNEDQEVELDADGNLMITDINSDTSDGFGLCYLHAVQVDALLKFLLESRAE